MQQKHCALRNKRLIKGMHGKCMGAIGPDQDYTTHQDFQYHQLNMTLSGWFYVLELDNDYSLPTPNITQLYYIDLNNQTLGLYKDSHLKQPVITYDHIGI